MNIANNSRIIEKILFHTQQLISNPPHAGENKPHTDALVEIFESISGISALFDMNEWQDANLQSGVAISPVQAARCLQETVRTQIFLKGINAAIQDKLKEHNELHILYAGTGPYGTLLLPLLKHYKNTVIKVTLIDIHRENIDALHKVIETLDISEQIKHIEIADATMWQPSDDEKYDLIISETMNNLLRREPQVAIFRHLQQFLKADGDLIPQQIKIGAELITLNSNHSSNYLTDITASNSNEITQHLGYFFQCNRETMAALYNGDNSCLSGVIPIPATVTSNNRYSLRFTTTMDIYGEYQLSRADSSLNIPILYHDLKLKAGKAIHFEYLMSNDPQFIFDIPVVEVTKITSDNAHQLPGIEEMGQLNIVHLKRLWQKSQLNRNHHLAKSIIESEWSLDSYLLDLLATSSHETFAYLYQQQPSFSEFETWLSKVIKSDLLNRPEETNKAFLEHASEYKQA